MDSKEKIFNIYMFFKYFVIFPFFLIFAVLYLFVLEVEEVDEIFIRFGSIGLMVSILMSLVVFLYLFKYLRITNNYLDFLKTFGAYLVFVPGLWIFYWVY